MRRLLLALSLSAQLAGLAAAQRHKLTINAETPEGQQLQAIGTESSPDRKLALMEDFVQKHPKHEGTPWVLEQMISAYLKANQHEKALSAGEKLMALDPDDFATAHNALKAAEGKKDPALVRQWATTTSKLARKAAAAPKPADEDGIEDWKKSVEYAKQVDTYTEYALYTAALAAGDLNQRLALAEALESQNPRSQYLPQVQGPVFLALRQAGQNDKAVAYAEKVLQNDQSNEDMLLVVADNYLNKRANPDKVIQYSNKLVEVMEAKPKPEGVADADWARRKTLLTGLGYWMAGVTYGTQNKFKESDAALRKALPLVEGNEGLKAQTLFYLGLANYKIAEAAKDKNRIADALRYNAQCAAIKSPFQAQAAQNAQVIRKQYGLR